MSTEIIAPTLDLVSGNIQRNDSFILGRRTFTDSWHSDPTITALQPEADNIASVRSMGNFGLSGT